MRKTTQNSETREVLFFLQHCKRGLFPGTLKFLITKKGDNYLLTMQSHKANEDKWIRRFPFILKCLFYSGFTIGRLYERNRKNR